MNRDGKDTQDGTISNHPEFLCSRKNPSECRRVVGLMGCRLSHLRLNIGRILLLFVLAIAEGASEDGSEQSAKHGSGGCTAFGVVHGAGAADEHCGGEREDDEFIFHNITVFLGVKTPARTASYRTHTYNIVRIRNILRGENCVFSGVLVGLGESPRRGAFCSALMTLNSSILLLRLGDRLGL